MKTRSTGVKRRRFFSPVPPLFAVVEDMIGGLLVSFPFFFSPLFVPL